MNLTIFQHPVAEVGERSISLAKRAVKGGLSIIGLETFRVATLRFAASAMEYCGKNNICLANALKLSPGWVNSHLRFLAKNIMIFKNETCQVASIPLKSGECLAVGGVIEEVICRLAIQEILLRQIPRKMIQKFFPGHEESIDFLPVRIMRVASSSLFFTFLHQSPFFLNCSTQGMTVILVMSVAYSILQEATHNPLYSIYFHARHNLTTV